MRLHDRLAASMVLPLGASAFGPSGARDTGSGASPAMPAPESMLIPMVNIAPVGSRAELRAHIGSASLAGGIGKDGTMHNGGMAPLPSCRDLRSFDLIL